MKHNTGRFIVKIQLPLVTNAPTLEAFVYNKNKTHLFHYPVSKELLKRMNGEPKKFFWARMKGLEMHLGEEAPFQDW